MQITWINGTYNVAMAKVAARNVVILQQELNLFIYLLSILVKRTGVTQKASLY